MSQVVIQDITPRTQITATAGQTVFNTIWTADVASDVLVYARASGVVADDTTQLVSDSNYTISFVGSSETVRVTFAVGRALNDIITIVRATPAERTNLYINTNFTPSMLNQDFGILTLVDQQDGMYDTVINPGYNVSAIIDEKDKVLPILIANQVWAMNNDNDEIIAYNVPAGGGLAPADATYILKTPNSYLPNAQPLNALATGIMISTNGTGVVLSRVLAGTSNQLGITNPSGITGNPTYFIVDNARLPGNQGLGMPTGTTAQRPVTPIGTNLRFNTTLGSFEFWSGTDWVQVEDSDDIDILLARLAAHTPGDGASMIGLENQGSVIDKTVQDMSEVDFITLTDSTGTLVNGIILGDVAVTLNTTQTITGQKFWTNGFTRLADIGTGYALFTTSVTTGGAHIIGYGGPGVFAVVDLDPIPDSGHAANVRLFRTTNTMSDVTLDIHLGDGSLDMNHQLAGKGIDSSLCSNNGNLAIGYGGTVITINATSGIDKILDEDNLVSDSATALATQQSIKAYIDTGGGTGSGFVTLSTSQTITGVKNWTNGLTVLASSGSGYALFTRAATTGGATIDGYGGAGADALVDLNPVPDNGFTATVRMFRRTNTSANTAFNIYIGDNTGTLNHQLAGKGGDTYLCFNNGNLLIGNGTTTTFRINLTTGISSILNDGTLSANSATALATQQSIKTYVDARASTTTTTAGTSQAMAVGTTYIALAAGQTTYTLPSTYAVGARVGIIGSTANVGGWVLTAAAGDTIRVNNATTSSGGSVTSAAVAGQTIYLVADVANTSWVMTSTTSTILTTT